MLAGELHFGRAAQRLHLAQPSLTHQIQVLERELGSELFIRGPRGVQLTDAGRALLEHADDVLDAVGRAEDAARRRAPGTRRIVVAFVGEAGRHLLPAAIRRYREEQPGVSVVLRELGGDALNAALLDGRVHAALLYLPAALDRSIAVRELEACSLVVHVPVDHPLADQPALHPSDLRDMIFVRLDRESPIGGWIPFVEQLLGRYGVTPTFSEEQAASLRQVQHLIAAGVGGMICPAPNHAAPPETVRTIPLSEGTVVLGTATATPHRRAVTAFLDLLAEATATHAPAGRLLRARPATESERREQAR